jgi:hypothetical protein
MERDKHRELNSTSAQVQLNFFDYSTLICLDIKYAKSN